MLPYHLVCEVFRYSSHESRLICMLINNTWYQELCRYKYHMIKPITLQIFYLIRIMCHPYRIDNLECSIVQECQGYDLLDAIKNFLISANNMLKLIVSEYEDTKLFLRLLNNKHIFKYDLLTFLEEIGSPYPKSYFNYDISSQVVKSYLQINADYWKAHIQEFINSIFSKEKVFIHSKFTFEYPSSLLVRIAKMNNHKL